MNIRNRLVSPESIQKSRFELNNVLKIKQLLNRKSNIFNNINKI